MSDSKRHDLWRAVGRNFDQFEREALDGYEPVAEVHIAGRGEPFRVGQVHTRRDPDFPWVLLMAVRPGDADPEKLDPYDQMVFAHESTILRVEITYVPKAPDAKRPIGFTHTEDLQVDDDPR